LIAEYTSKRILGTAFFYAIIVLLAYVVYIVFQPFLVALAWAAILVVVSYPVYQRLSRHWGRTWAALAATTAVTLILIVPTVFLIYAFLRQAVSGAQSLMVVVHTGQYSSRAGNLWMHLQQKFPTLIPANLSATLGHYAEEAATFIARHLGSALEHTAEILFDLFVTVLAMFYLFRDGHAIIERLRDILPFEPERRERIVHDTRELIYATVTSTLAAAAMHGALGGIAFTIVGIRAAVFWGVMMGFFSLVPVVGSALIWVPISVAQIINGHTASGIFLLIFCSIIVGGIDNIVRPWLISGRAEMSALVVFISIVGGVAVFGLLGVVLGPIVVAIAADMLNLYAPSGSGRKIRPKPGGSPTSAVLQ
jgi:predicted PurR-regulated permease PerM